MPNQKSALTGSMPAPVLVHNATGSDIPPGTLVYVSGMSSSGVLQVTPASNVALSSLAQLVVVDPLANGSDGNAYFEGVVPFNTNSGNRGDPVYLTTNGAISLTAPAASANAQIVGRVLTKAVLGTVQVFLQGRFAAPTTFQSGLTVTTQKWTYDFSVLGGAQGTIALTGPSLAVNTVIVAGFLDVITALGSGGSATAAVTVQNANDVVTATAFGSSPWATSGARKAIVPVWSDMTKAIKVASTAKTPSIVIATADLNAGKFNLFLETAQSD